MTAIAIYRSQDSIVFASDGASYDPSNGAFTGCTSKVALMPEWSCVIAQRGAGGFLALLRARLGPEVVDFDDLLDRLPTHTRGLHADFVARGYPYPNVSLFIGGWSEARERFETYTLRSRDISLPNAEGGEPFSIEAFKLAPLPEFHAAPYPTEELFERFGAGTNALPMTAADLTLRTVCAARALRCAPSEEDKCEYVVGGFLQLTILKRNEIASEIVHRWPDPVGEKIDPTRGEPLPAFLANAMVSTDVRA